MALLCKNCAGSLYFDPELGRLVCRQCDGRFEVTHSDDTGIVDLGSLFKDTSDPELCDNNVYSCSTCGGSIIVNDVEMTARCPFCENEGVIFDRVEKSRRPDALIPFKFGEEKALALVRQHLKKSKFLSRRAKKMELSTPMGIYIPHYIVEADFLLSLEYEKRNRDDEVVDIGKQNLRCSFDQLSVEASSALINDAGILIKPYDLSELRKFEEGYLMGFYSDRADDNAKSLYELATSVCQDAINDYVTDHKVIPKGYTLTARQQSIQYKGHGVYALFPVWFVGGEFAGEHITFLVNAQTGKVVGGPSVNKAMFGSAVAMTSCLTIPAMSLVGALGAIGIYLVLLVSAVTGVSGMVIFIAMIATLLATFMINQFRKAKKNLDRIRHIVELSASKSLIKFSDRRKEK